MKKFKPEEEQKILNSIICYISRVYYTKEGKEIIAETEQQQKELTITFKKIIDVLKKQFPKGFTTREGSIYLKKYLRCKHPYTKWYGTKKFNFDEGRLFQTIRKLSFVTPIYTQGKSYIHKWEIPKEI